jgi:hypothetical protein
VRSPDATVRKAAQSDVGTTALKRIASPSNGTMFD